MLDPCGKAVHPRQNPATYAQGCGHHEVHSLLDVHKPKRQVIFQLLAPFADEKTEAQGRGSAQHRKSTTRSFDFLGNFLPLDVELHPR